jgi:hypothetical protein
MALEATRAGQCGKRTVAIVENPMLDGFTIRLDAARQFRPK